VAYVGNARIGLIGIGDNYEEQFWELVGFFSKAGPPAGMRLATDNVKLLWTVFAQIFYGDPEMPVWTKFPQLYQITHKAQALWGHTFSSLSLVVSRDNFKPYIAFLGISS